MTVRGPGSRRTAERTRSMESGLRARQSRERRCTRRHSLATTHQRINRSPDTALQCREGRPPPAARRRSSRDTFTTQRARRNAHRQGPLRQPQLRRRPETGIQPGPGGDRAVDRVPLALRHRGFLPPTASKEHTRRAVRKGRSAASGATTSSPSPRSAPWPSSRRWSTAGTRTTTPGWP